MPTNIFAAENTGARVYKIGRVGLDTGTADTGGNYTGTFKTEKFSPAGEDGLVYFRRVAIRIWHTGGFTITLTVWIDGVQTQYYNAGALTNQTIQFVQAAPMNSPAESVLEADLIGQGTYIEVQGTIVSNTVTGVCLPESLEVHGIPLRAAKSRGTAETT